jgi:hypothetical protein
VSTALCCSQVASLALARFGMMFTSNLQALEQNMQLYEHPSKVSSYLLCFLVTTVPERAPNRCTSCSPDLRCSGFTYFQCHPCNTLQLLSFAAAKQQFHISNEVVVCAGFQGPGSEWEYTLCKA